jgi:fatty-acyl-CoA synthase
MKAAGVDEGSSWVADTTVGLRDSTVGSTLAEAARCGPGATALVAQSVAAGKMQRWTFQQLLEEAQRVAGAVLGRFQVGERVAVWGPNVAEVYLVQLGAAMAGMTVVPIPLALRHGDLRHLLGQSGVAGIFLIPQHRGVAMAQTVKDVRADLVALREVVDLTSWAEFLDSADGESMPAVGTQDPAQIMYTSGSTGLPKGAVLHHQGITNASRFVAERMGVGPGDVWLNFMPLSYVAGSSISALAALASGAAQVLCDFEPAGVLARIEAERCTAFVAGPTMYRMLLECPSLAATDLSSLRTLASGGSVLSPALARDVQVATGARMSVIYGLTEACGIAVATSYDDEEHDRTTTIGRPLPHIEVQIVDPPTGAVLPRGEGGELRLRGYQVMDGYLDLPNETAEAVDDRGWLHTGDLATMDERGQLRIAGRLKEIINRGGRKIGPGEIEEVLQSHPAVAQAAVVGVPDERFGEEIAAFVKVTPGASVDEETLVGWCRSQLAPFKTPKRWAFVDDLPLTSAGKVRKFLLRESLAP